jgi:hypothetical protein
MIKFLHDYDIEVVEQLGDTRRKIESVKAGEEVDAEVVFEYDNDHVDIQFGDGSVAMGIPRIIFHEFAD